MRNIKEIFPAHKDTVEFGPDVCCAFENCELSKQNEDFLREFIEKNVLTGAPKDKNFSFGSLFDIFKKTVSLGLIPNSFEREFYAAAANNEIDFLTKISEKASGKLECGHGTEEHISALTKIKEKLSEKYSKN